MTPTSRVRFEPTEGPSACSRRPSRVLGRLHDRLNARALNCRADARGCSPTRTRAAAPRQVPPSERPPATGRCRPFRRAQEARASRFSGHARSPRCSSRVNPGPEGERAEGDLGRRRGLGRPPTRRHRARRRQRLAAVESGALFQRNRAQARIQDRAGRLPIFMHRGARQAPGRTDVRVDDNPGERGHPSATALTLFYAGRAPADRGQGIYFYLPKLETPDEARFYRECRRVPRALPFLRNATVRGIILVESPAVRVLHGEMLHALGPTRPGSTPRLGPQGLHLEYVDDRSKIRLADRFRRGYQDDAVPVRHLPPARRESV